MTKLMSKNSNERKGIMILALISKNKITRTAIMSLNEIKNYGLMRRSSGISACVQTKTVNPALVRFQEEKARKIQIDYLKLIKYKARGLIHRQKSIKEHLYVSVQKILRNHYIEFVKSLTIKSSLEKISKLFKKQMISQSYRKMKKNVLQMEKRMITLKKLMILSMKWKLKRSFGILRNNFIWQKAVSKQMKRLARICNNRIYLNGFNKLIRNSNSVREKNQHIKLLDKFQNNKAKNLQKKYVFNFILI